MTLSQVLIAGHTLISIVAIIVGIFVAFVAVGALALKAWPETLALRP